MVVLVLYQYALHVCRMCYGSLRIQIRRSSERPECHVNSASVFNVPFTFHLQFKPEQVFSPGLNSY